jgi:hypothetical protein
MDIYQIILQISMKINNFILALHNKIFLVSSTDLLDNKGIIKETSNSLRNYLT